MSEEKRRREEKREKKKRRKEKKVKGRKEGSAIPERKASGLVFLFYF